MAKLKDKVGEGTEQSGRYDAGEPEMMLTSLVRNAGFDLVGRVEGLQEGIRRQVDIISSPGGGMHAVPSMRPVIAALRLCLDAKLKPVSGLTSTQARALLQLDDLWLSVLGYDGKRWALACRADKGLSVRVERLEKWSGWLGVLHGWIMQEYGNWSYDGPAFAVWVTPEAPEPPPPDYRL